MASGREKQACTSDMIDEDEMPDTTNPKGLVGDLPERYHTLVRKIRGEVDLTDTQKRFIAYGPTKVGKTASIRAIEKEDPDNTVLLEYEASRLLGDNDAQTFRNIDKAFATARKARGRGKKVILLMTNLHHLTSVAHRDEVRKVPLEHLETCLTEMERQKDMFFVGEVRDLNQLPANFLHQFDASGITRYSSPDDQSRCEMLAYQFLKHNFGGEYISRSNLRQYVSGSRGMSYGDLESVRRDTVLQAKEYNNGDISPQIIRQVIRLTREKNRDREDELKPKEPSALKELIAQVIVPNLNISNIAMAAWYIMSIRNDMRSASQSLESPVIGVSQPPISQVRRRSQ